MAKKKASIFDALYTQDNSNVKNLFGNIYSPENLKKRDEFNKQQSLREQQTKQLESQPLIDNLNKINALNSDRNANMKLNTVGINQDAGERSGKFTPNENFYRESNPLTSFGLGLLNSALLGSLEAQAKREGNPIFDIAKQNKKSYIAGDLLGYVVPGAGTAKATKLGYNLAGKTIGNTLKDKLMRGAIEGALFSGAESAAQGEFKPESLATNIGFGLGGETLFHGIGKGLGKLSEAAKKSADLLPEIKGTDFTGGNIQKPSMVQKLPTIETPKLQDKLPQLSTKNKVVAEAIRPLKINNTMEVPLSEIAPTNTSINGNPLSLSTKNRKFIESVKGSEIVPKEMKKALPNQPYVPITNKETWSNALNKVDTDHTRAMREFLSQDELRHADDTALGQALIVKAIKENRIADANELSIDLAERLTKAGQTVQAASIFKRLSPEGMLQYANKTVNNINKDLVKDFGKKAEKVKLTEEEANNIINGMKKIQNMPDGRLKDIEFAKVKKIIADKTPVNAIDKLNTWRRIAMLLNPKTMVRNTLGNVIMTGLENVKDIPTSLIDKAVSLKTGNRTTLFPSLEGLKTQGKGMLKGAKETLQDARLGINTNPSMGQFELPQSQTFKKGILGKAEKLTNTGLTLGDRPFYQGAYDEALRQQMKINNTTKPTQEMIDTATKIAEDKTFQNDSHIAKGFGKLRDSLNDIGKSMGIGSERIGLGNAVLPFTKTPANILDKATDYTPIGSLKAVTQLLSKKEFNQKMFVDRLGRSLTGTAIIALGADLARNGLITGAANKDKDLASFEKQIGKSPYAFKIGDTYRTFDWAQPASTALAIGADMYNSYKNSKDVNKAIGEAIASGGSTLFNQSLLQGVQKFFGGNTTGTNNILSNVGNAGQSLVTSLIPTTSKQIAQLIDPYQRDISSGMGAQIKSKIPGLSKSLPSKVDTLGNPMLQYQGNNNPFNVFLNPGFTAKENNNPVQKIIYDTYKATGDNTIFPRISPNSITYKNKPYDLTSEEQINFQKSMGESTNKTINNNLNKLRYLTPTERAKELRKIVQKSYDDTKKQFLNSKGIY